MKAHFFLKSFLNELLKPPLSCFRLRSLKGVWLFSSVPLLHFDSSPHDWIPESWGFEHNITFTVIDGLITSDTNHSVSVSRSPQRLHSIYN